MAPLSLNDRVNLSATIGTWLGSLFTAIGLIAVLSQLRAILVSNRTRQERFVSRAAGIWSSCFNIQTVQGEGTVEQAAPALAGWMQTVYLNDRTTKLMQSDTRVAGTSSWSKLFAQCSIGPSELVSYGGNDALVLPVGSTSRRAPTQADLRIEDGKLEYGFSATEFAALLIMAGLSSDDFKAKGTSSSVGYLGTMHLADYGPFSQIAHFDPHAGTKIMEVELTRLVHDVPIQAAIHVALGILRLSPKRGERQWIVLPSHIQQSEGLAENQPQQFRNWTELPRTNQLNKVRYNIEQLALVSGGDILTYSNGSIKLVAHEKQVMNTIQQASGLVIPSEPRQGAAMLGAYAVDALRPWALLPIAPKHFLEGFADIIRPFVATREETLGELSNRLRLLPAEGTFAGPKSGWKDAQEQIDSLNCIGDIKTEFFCRSSNYCAYYYEAMVKVFKDAGLPFQTVRRRLAAEVAFQMLKSATAYPNAGDSTDEKEHRSMFISKLLSHLDEDSPPQNKEARIPYQQNPFEAGNSDHGEITWAVKIYATYLWGWLHDRQETDAFHFLAGLSTGILSASLLQPADLLKTRVQQSHSTSLLHTFQHITRGPNSLRHLWRGTLPSVIRTGLGSALYFSTLNALRQHVFRSNLLASAGVVTISSPPGATRPSSSSSSSSSSLPQLSNLANLTTGAIARASAGLIMMPITVIKVRYESSLYSYTSLLSASSSIFKQEGLKGFFAGFGATAIRDAPYAGLYVVFYEQSKRYLSSLKDVAAPLSSSSSSSNTGSVLGEKMKNSSAISVNFLSGALAAGLATTITNPFDAVKTRLQLMPGRYANMVQASRQMIREEGFRSLFDGLGLRAGRKAISSALAWTVYEELVRRAETRWTEADVSL
ncbi:MAG: hypothetical protein Q9224_004896 [Gallowayella concinna]